MLGRSIRIYNNINLYAVQYDVEDEEKMRKHKTVFKRLIYGRKRFFLELHSYITRVIAPLNTINSVNLNYSHIEVLFGSLSYCITHHALQFQITDR